jgi:hypothetical protein
MATPVVNLWLSHHTPKAWAREEIGQGQIIREQSHRLWHAAAASAVRRGSRYGEARSEAAAIIAAQFGGRAMTDLLSVGCANLTRWFGTLLLRAAGEGSACRRSLSTRTGLETAHQQENDQD